MIFAGELTVAYCDVTINLNVVEVCGGGEIKSKHGPDHDNGQLSVVLNKKRVVLGVLCKPRCNTCK